MRSGKSIFQPTSLSHLLDPPSSSTTLSSSIDMTEVDLRPNGVPIIITSEPAAYIYDIPRSEWSCICSRWYLEGTPSTEPRRARADSAGPLAEIEAQVTEALDGRQTAEGDKPEWWNEAMEMGHLETRIRAAELLDSKEEYKHWLIRYAAVLGKEGFRARSEELVKELVGPIYQSVFIPLPHITPPLRTSCYFPMRPCHLPSNEKRFTPIHLNFRCSRHLQRRRQPPL